MSASPLDSLARLPHPGDNAAIALRRLEVGTSIVIGGAVATLAHTVLEGHRFAVRAVAAGEALLSWSRPFGYALAPIRAGEYLCNAQTLEVLAARDLQGASLPPAANFANRVEPYRLDPGGFRPGAQVPPAPDAGAPAFAGYPRGGDRGTGLRNHLVILGTSGRTAAFVRALAADLRSLPAADGVVAAAHTEGGGSGPPHNRTELLRTLAGFLVHPNVGAVVAVDEGNEPVNNALLAAFAQENGYPLAQVRHHFLSIGGLAPAEAARRVEAIVRSWAPLLAAESRVPVPFSALRIGLQCGGSDAFSGVSGNPLVGRVGREIIRRGGSVNLAETDELVGAEGYVLANVRDRATAERVLALVAGFKERLAWHGATVEGNPSGGNRLRGLYNINLKSLGAAMKKDPEVRLDHAIDYAERMHAAGFYFMNSPGNDLESVAGQVGAGCNLIFFTTGNGSVTNFPFVPTIKVTTTTRRHRLLEREMDFNAGAYLDGASMDDLTADLFSLVQRVAGGERTKGEQAGHSQVSLWREWRQVDPSQVAALRRRDAPTGEPVPRASPAGDGEEAGIAEQAARSLGRMPRVNLVIPTSMCSSQIARMAADRLNQTPPLPGLEPSSFRPGYNEAAGRAVPPAGSVRYAALPHSEGCGFAGDELYRMLPRTFRGYATHPAVARALFLEHGCEKIPNDLVRRELESSGFAPGDFGWASVQRDGGIAAVLAKIDRYFQAAAGARHRPSAPPAVALISEPPIADGVAEAAGRFASAWLDAGATVLIAANDPLLDQPAFASALGLAPGHRPSLAYGEAFARPGLHIVATETQLWSENLSGLGACGAEAFVAFLPATATTVRPAHPFIPVIRYEAGPAPAAAEIARAVVDSATAAIALPALAEFQLTRGELGIST